MGIFSWLFRRKEYSEILEELQKYIQSLENKITRYHKRQDWLLPQIYKFMVALALTLSIVSYFWFGHWIFAVFSVLAHLILTFFLQKTITFYFDRRISSCKKQIQHYQALQQQKLDQMKEETNFEQTHTLIQKYAKKPEPPVTPPIQVNGPATSAGSSPRPPLPSGPTNHPIKTRPRSASLQHQHQVQPQQPRPAAAASGEPSTTVADGQSPIAEPGVAVGDSAQVPSKSSGWLDKLVDLAVGQNPANCVALICQQCFTHNGLIMLEDWTDHPIRFKCISCGFLNKPKQGEVKPETTTASSASSTSSAVPASSAATDATNSANTTTSTANTASSSSS